MQKQQIIQANQTKNQELVDWLEQQPSEKYATGPAGKWATGQHLVHLTQSVAAMNKALTLPNFFLRWKFGTANRPSRSFDEVVEKYLSRLATAKAEGREIVSPFSKNMSASLAENKASEIADFQRLNAKFLKKVGKYDERDLDVLILPHPAMGRMTLREILMWNAYHTEHHLQILKEKY